MLDKHLTLLHEGACLFFTFSLLAGISCREHKKEIVRCTHDLISGYDNLHSLVASLPDCVVALMTDNPGDNGELQFLGPPSQSDILSGTSFFLSSLGTSLVLLSQSEWFNNRPDDDQRQRLSELTSEFQLTLDYLKAGQESFVQWGTYLNDDEAKSIGNEFIKLTLQQSGEISMEGNIRVYPGGETFLGDEKQIAWTESLQDFYFTYALSWMNIIRPLTKRSRHIRPIAARHSTQNWTLRFHDLTK